MFSQFAFAWQLAPPKKFELYLSMHSSVPSNGVVVCDVVCDEVAVVVVVGVEVADVVRELVAVVVTVEVAVEVGVEVADVVGLVVGVVTSQSWNPPAAYASVISFSVAAAALQSDESTKNLVNEHTRSSSSSPAGPRNSVMAAVSAAAVASHADVVSTIAAYSTLLIAAASHDSVPAVVGHASSTALNRLA